MWHPDTFSRFREFFLMGKYIVNSSLMWENKFHEKDSCDSVFGPAGARYAYP